MDGKVPPLYKISSKAKQTHCNNTSKPQPFPLHLRDDFKVKDEGRLSVLFSWKGVEVPSGLLVWSLQGNGKS